MKAISLWQPWATLMAIGAKKIETRSWYTNQRGPVAIHAAKKWTDNLVLTCTSRTFGAALGIDRRAYDNIIEYKKDLTAYLPFGAILAVGILTDCVKTTLSNIPEDDEYYFGDYTPERFMWKFEKIIKLPEPIPYRGAQGFFNIREKPLIELEKYIKNG